MAIMMKQASRSATAGRKALHVTAAVKTAEKPRVSVPSKVWSPLNVTKSNLVNSLGGRTTRNIDGVVYDISYVTATDSICVIDKRRGVSFPALVADDNRIRVDLESPAAVAVAGPSFDSLREVLKGDSPAPEIINGRTAMVSIFAIAVVELATGQGIVQQFGSLTGLAGVLTLSALTTAATIAPALAGKIPTQNVIPRDNNSSPDAPLPYFWTPLAEKINGRAAMIGIVGLAINEVVRGAPLL